MNLTLRRAHLLTWVGMTLMLLTASTGQAAPLATCTSVDDGFWSVPATWSGCGGNVPQVDDAVIITVGHTVTVNTTTASLASLTVNGTLTFDATGTGYAMQVTGNVTVNSGGTLNVDTGGSATTHSLSVGGDLLNGGTFDALPAADRIINVTFNGSSNQTISGNGITTRFNLITVNNSGSSANNIVEVTSSNFSTSAGFLTLTGGIFKISGTFTFSNIFFDQASYSIPASAGLWLNNPNVTVTAQNGSPTLSGSLRIAKGTYNIGTSSGNALKYDDNAVFTMEGGVLNISGRFQADTTSKKIVFTMSGGTMVLVTVGQGLSSTASFDIPASGSSFTMSGGTIVLQNESTSGTPLDYRNLAGTTSITGGTVQFGNASTTGSPSFEVGLTGNASVFPNLTINSVGTPSVKLYTSIAINGNVIIGNGTTLAANDQNLTLTGNWTNNGTFTPGTGTVTFNGSNAQAIGGTSSTVFNNLTINNSSTIANGVNLGTAQTANGTLTLTTGFLKLNANDLTLGSTALAVAGTPSASKMLVINGNGRVCKDYSGAGTYTLPIGENTGTAEYSPATFDVTAGSGTLCVRGVDAEHPNRTTSIAHYISRYWIVSGSGSPTYSPSFTFVAADVTGNTNNMSGKKWDGSYPWTQMNAASSTTFAGSGINTFSEFTAFETGALAVQIERFEAIAESGHILVRWETVNEIGNQGFHLYRAVSPDGSWIKLNTNLIPSQSPGSPWGYVYEWMDRDVIFGERYLYRLASMDMAGLAEVVDTTEAQYGEWQRVWLPAVGR